MMGFSEEELNAIAEAVEDTTWNDRTFIINIKDGIFFKNIENKYNVEESVIADKLNSLKQEDLKALEEFIKSNQHKLPQ